MTTQDSLAHESSGAVKMDRDTAAAAMLTRETDSRARLELAEAQLARAEARLAQMKVKVNSEVNKILEEISETRELVEVLREEVGVEQTLAAIRSAGELLRDERVTAFDYYLPTLSMQKR